MKESKGNMKLVSEINIAPPPSLPFLLWCTDGGGEATFMAKP